jgi:hypothetical protein
LSIKKFLKTDKKPTKNRQKPIKTDKNRFLFFGLRPDRQKPTVKTDIDLQARWDLQFRSSGSHTRPFLLPAPKLAKQAEHQVTRQRTLLAHQQVFSRHSKYNCASRF